MSASVRPASGVRTPGISLHGRRFTYWSKPRRIGISRPHSEMWSGTSGQPTAPSRIESDCASCSSPSAGIIAPVFL